MRLSALDKKILNVIQEEIPLSSEPFKILARNVGITEDRFLGKIKEFKEKGIIRVFSARLNHKKLDFKSTLIALRVPEEKLEQITRYLIKFNEVTHCYLREGEYNLYFVFLYKNETLKGVIDKICEQIGMENCLNLKTVKQFKLKTRLKI